MKKHPASEIVSINKQKNQEETSTWQLEVLEPRLLLSADMIPGVHELEGVIEQPGEQDVYEFVLDKQSRFLFDGIQGTQINWHLDGPTAQDKFNSRALTAAGDRLLSLNAGKYRLTVDGEEHATGAYRFRLFGEEAAKPLVLNEKTSGSLSPSTQTMLYRFSLDKGDRIYFQSDNDKSYGVWTLFDSKGKVLANSNALYYDNAAITAGEAGEYWLSVEGAGWQKQNTLDYAFTLFRQPESRAALSFGQDISVSLMPGSLATYTFELEQAAHIGIDWLQSANSSVHWRVLNRENVSVLSGYANKEELSTAYLPRGYYTLQVESMQRYTGNAIFRVLSTKEAKTVQWQNNQFSTQSDDGKLQVYRLEVAQPAQLSMVLPDASNSSELQWLLTNEYGRQVGVGEVQDKVNTVSLNQSGTYYLWFNSRDSAQSENRVQLSLWQDKQPTVAVLPSDDALLLGGSLDYAGETLSFDFDISHSGVVQLTAENLPQNAVWTLRDTSGRILFSETTEAQQLPYLQQGRYRITVRSTTQQIGDVAIRAQSTQQLPSLPENEDVVLPSGIAGTTVLYRLNAEEYSQIQLKLSQGWQVALTDAFGRAISYDMQQDDKGFRLLTWDKKSAGDIYVLLTAEGTDINGTLHWSHTVANIAPLPAEDIIANRLVSRDFGDASGDKHFRFSLPKDGLAFIRFYEGNVGYWTLSGPRGKEYSGYGRQTLAYALPQGNYTLTLHNVQGKQAFAVGVLDNVNHIIANEVVNGELGADEAVRLYRFDSIDGQDMWFHVLNGMSSGLRYTVYDHSGNTIVYERDADNTALQKMVDKAGSYVMAVWRQNAAVQNPVAPLRFEWLTTPKSNSLSLVPNTRQNGSLAGYRHYYDYAFTLDNAAVLQVEVAEAKDLSFTLYDKSGNSYGSLDGRNSHYHYVLGRGEYYLRVQYNHWQDVVSLQDFSFTTKLTLGGQSSMLSEHAEKAVDFSDENSNSIFHMNLTGDKRYWIGSNTDLEYGQNIHAHIFDADGKLVREQVFSGSTWYSNRQSLHGFVFTPTQTGRYTVVFTPRYNTNTATGVLNTILKVGQHTHAEYTVGGRVDGNLSHLKDLADYTFSLPEKQQLWLDMAGVGYTAQVMRRSDNQVVFSKNLEGNNQYNVGSLFELEAGDYILRLLPTQLVPGAYSFRLLDTNRLPLLADNEKSTQTAEQGRYALAWQFSGKAGETVLVDIRSTETQYWSVLDNAGNIIASNYNYHKNDDAQKITLPLDGRYILQTHADINKNTSDIVSVYIRRPQTLKNDIQENSRITGQITGGGDVHRYHFKLDEAQTVVFSGYGGTAEVNLYNPRGEHLQAIGLNPHDYTVRRLPAGNYHIEIRGSHSSIPAYDFAFHTLVADVKDLNSAADLEGSIAVGRNYQVYSLEVRAGQRYVLNTIPNNHSLRYSVVDEHGTLLVNQTYASSQSAAFFTAEHTGKIYLLVHRYNTAVTHPVTFSATLRQPIIGKAVSLPFGNIVSGSLGSREDSNRYTFRLERDTLLSLKQLQASHNGIQLQLSDVGGKQIANHSYWNWYQDKQGYTVLPKGDYVLTISNNWDTPADYSFQAALEAATTVHDIRNNLLPKQIQYDESITIPEDAVSSPTWSGVVKSGRIQELYFEAETDGLYYLDLIKSDSYGYYHQLVQLFNNQGREMPIVHDSPIYLTKGKYLLRLKQEDYADGTVEYRWHNLSQVPRILLGEAVKQELILLLLEPTVSLSKQERRFVLMH